MGYPITTPDDYTGVIAISTNKYTRKDLEAYILSYEEEILEKLLGCEMAADLISDLDITTNIPTAPKYLDIWSSFCIDDETNIWFVNENPFFYNYHPNYNGYGCKIQWKSKGILELLKYQIYFYFTRDQQTVNTITGNVKGENEVSVLAAISQSNMVRNYNISLEWFWAIQWKIYKNENDYDYTNYNGTLTQPISIL